MSYYGGTVTVGGRNLITNLVAGSTIEFTRVVVGAGAMPEGVEPIDMEDLVEPIAEGTSTVPIAENGQVSMIVEYRNDLNGGLKKGFWLREFGVYAKTANTEEILLYYGTLGDSPQPVNAYQDNRVDIRRYPISIAFEVDASIQLGYIPGAFITSKNAEELIAAMLKEELSVYGVVKSIAFAIKPEEWVEDVQARNGYWFYYDLVDRDTKESLKPDVVIAEESLTVSAYAGVCQTATSYAGYTRMKCKERPTGTVVGTCYLLGKGASGGGGEYSLPVATRAILGGIRASDSVTVDDDGTAHAVGEIGDGSFATDEEVDHALDKGFGAVE